MWIKRVVWAVAALAVLMAAVWLGAPPLMKSQGEARLSAALGRTVTLGRVVIEPWRLQLVVDDIAVAGAAGDPAPLLTIDRLLANVSASSLFRFAPVLEALEVTRPRVRVAHTAAGHYDIDDLIARFTPKPSPEPAGEPARFAVYNVQVTDGELRFDDRPAGRVHELRQLQLSLPFLSNLPAQVEVKVEPRLAFVLNDASFDTGAQATPFAQTRSGTLKLGIDRFDLAPYLVYAPKALPVKVVRGVFDSDLEAAFSIAPDGQPSVTLRGSVEARDVAVATTADAELLGWKSLKVGLADVQPLARKLHFASVHLDGLSVQARRLADGRIDGMPVPAPDAAASAPPPPAAASTASGASAVLAPAAPPPWQVKVDTFTLEHGQVAWRDASVTPAAALDLVDVTAKVGPVHHPAATPMPLSASLRIRSAGEKPQDWGSVSVDGEGGATGAVANLTADAIALEALQPYLNAVATPRVAGRLSAQGRIDWAGGTESPRLQVRIASATVDALKVTEAGTRLARAPNVEAIGLKQAGVADVTVDVLARSVSVGEVRLQQPSVALQRSDEGTWSAQRWAVAPATAASVPEAPASAASAPWKVTLKSFALEGGRVRVSDARLATGGKPLLTEVSAIDVNVRDLVLDGDRPVPPATVRLSAKTGTGQVRFDGKAGLAPRMAAGTVALTRFPIHAFAPYAGLTPNVAVARAEAGFKGTVAVRLPVDGVDAQVKGDVLLADVLLQTRGEDGAGPGDDLLQWQGLALDGLTFQMKPAGKPRLEIDSATLNALQARLVVTEQGRLNLQDAAGTRVGPQGPDAAASAPASAASAPVAAPSVAASGVARAGGNSLPIDVTLSSTRLTNGRIDFSDNFVRPKYSAELTQLNGRLGAISTAGSKTADLELKGRAAGTADLEISGQVQPLAHPISLDIKARASDLELAPLSPYAAKYVGYAIERGKLTMQVAYRIDPDGRLDASNQVIVNQLTFGEKVASPQATTLPVRLAVSLLTDRNGVIDINLPISGSLDDPEFSVAGMVWKVLGNLIAKAVTAPFSLLSGGGKTDISMLPAVPGSARLTEDGMASIDKVATALTDRPSLRLTITGTSDGASERDAYQRQVLDARLVAERRKEALATGGSAEAAASLSAADRSRLLKLLYKQADLPDKPRNALGFTKDLPDAELATRLAARVPVDDDVMRELALQRAVSVRDAIAAKGVPVQRLFLAAPKGREGDGWVPSVKLTLAME